MDKYINFVDFALKQMYDESRNQHLGSIEWHKRNCSVNFLALLTIVSGTRVYIYTQQRRSAKAGLFYLEVSQSRSAPYGSTYQTSQRELNGNLKIWQ